jgi:serine/threonine-protein kinase
LALVGAVAVLVGSTAGYLYATHVIFPVPEGEEGEYLEVPDLRGARVADAETLLRDRGLQMGTVDSVSHPDLDPGLVVGQDPFPGQLAVPAGTVALSVSSGPERRSVPDVVRMRSDQALTALRTAGFTVEVDSLEADLPQGRVVATNPAAGEEMSLPGVVRIVVSLGPPQFPMPDLLGLTEEEARILLDSLGLGVGDVGTRFSFLRGREVIEQYPLPDSLVSAGAEVRLIIGRGL